VVRLIDGLTGSFACRCQSIGINTIFNSIVSRLLEAWFLCFEEQSTVLLSTLLFDFLVPIVHHSDDDETNVRSSGVEDVMYRVNI
jgi:hypothetical protein